MNKKVFLSIAALAFAMVFSSATGFCGNVRYLSNNIHTQRSNRGELKASYANWINPGAGHQIIPVNTPVTVERWRRGFALITQDKGQKIYFEYNRRNMDFTIPEYIDLITAKTQTRLSGLSKVDRKGIKVGKALRGMTKTGVKIALGYPATHQTPSLEENIWIYWKDRWRRSAVTFNEKGKVISVR
ncbi:MAG: hypothetical protein DSY90_01600 [Deltaproteobacteria bacterium]|nr:MAG: hypothetical protein DSY90_01600 [Deltaproteobacteria bacterium]